MPEDAAWRRAVRGDDAMWTPTAQLLALIADTLRVANWQRTEDGAKGRRFPDPIERPGVARRDTTRRTARSLEDIKAWMAQWRPPETQPEDDDGA